MEEEKPNMEQIEHLIAKALRGKISAEEKILLDQWYDDQEKREAVLYTELSKAQLQEKLYRKTLQQPSLPIKKKAASALWLGVAASLALALTCGILIFQQKVHKAAISPVAATLVDTYKSGAGMRKKITLPDGSIIQLNSRSQISVSRDFSKERRVVLDGEAFFQVKRNESLPFTVETRGSLTKVLGTSFIVSSYLHSPEMVSVKTGKVKVQDKVFREAVYLIPSQQSLLSSEGLEVNRIPNPEFVFGWTEGKLMFKEASLEQIAVKLENWYGVEVNVSEGKGSSCLLTGTYTDLSIEDLMRLIQYSINIEYQITGKKLKIISKGC